ncbi:MAG: rhomboid family intramembrane serine protease [Thermoprotei archaeon]|nr:MAG: rhomboid family intramembrane serine protease [Thermoprotei archaeon]
MLPLYDENRSYTTPVVTYMLIAANVAIFFYFFFQGLSSLENAIKTLGVIPIYIINGRRLWTLITSMFMHADILHLGGNMLYLYIFGDNVEDAFGRLKYLVFYILCGLGASFIHISSIMVSLPTIRALNLRIPAVGASGAISGVLGAYMILYPHARIRTLVMTWIITIVTIPAYYYIGMWFLYQFLMGVWSLTGLFSNVAFWAHIGGFVTGVFVVKLFKVKPKRRRRIIYRYYYVPVY